MKKRVSLISLLTFLAVATTLVATKWHIWFDNEPEHYEAYTPQPQHLMLLPCADFDHGRTLSWQCDTTLASRAYVEYATQNDTIRSMAQGEVVETRGAKSALYHAILDSLKPQSLYAYRVVCDQQHSPWHTFSTAADNDQRVEFLYLGDIQDTIQGETGQYFQQIEARHPNAEFWAFVGDIVEDPTAQCWDNWFSDMCGIATHHPIVAATGNHEYLKGVPNTLDKRWTHIFANPENGAEGFRHRTYHFEVDHTAFFVLDTNGMQSPLTIYRQYHWLKQLLEQCEQPWRIVMFHHPVYPIKQGRTAWLMREIFKPLFDRHHVQLVLQGHDHGYARRSSDGGNPPIYITSSCSPKSYKLDHHPDFDRIESDQKLYQHISICGDSLTYQSFTTDGVLFDQFIEVLRVDL